MTANRPSAQPVDVMATPAGLLIQLLVIASVSFLLPPSLIWFPIGLAIAAWLLMLLSGDQWKDLGFARPETRPARWVTEAVVTGLLLQFAAVGVLLPGLYALLGQTAPVRGHTGELAYLLSNILLYGIAGALAKGLGHRAFVLNRLERIFGNSQRGLVLTIVTASLLFGLANWYAGWTTVIVSALVGAVFNLLFYWSRRNIWPTIVAHSVYNIALFVLIYFGRI
jgi:membrane protease YdiL (CAAX protease family)